MGGEGGGTLPQRKSPGYLTFFFFFVQMQILTIAYTITAYLLYTHTHTSVYNIIRFFILYTHTHKHTGTQNHGAFPPSLRHGLSTANGRRREVGLVSSASPNIYAYSPSPATSGPPQP